MSRTEGARRNRDGDRDKHKNDSKMITSQKEYGRGMRRTEESRLDSR